MGERAVLPVLVVVFTLLVEVVPVVLMVVVFVPVVLVLVVLVGAVATVYWVVVVPVKLYVPSGLISAVRVGDSLLVLKVPVSVPVPL